MQAAYLLLRMDCFPCCCIRRKNRTRCYRVTDDHIACIKRIKGARKPRLIILHHGQVFPNMDDACFNMLQR